jgi:hypothetical protein
MNVKTLPILFVFACLAFSCKKENKQVPIQLLLTDNPVDYDEVNVEIIGIKVNLSKDSSSWISLTPNAGVYNLLDLQNGITTQLANGTVPEETLKEVRFILGTNNTVKANGTTYPLTIPSGSESGLKVKIDKRLNETLNTFTLDFDAALSVKEESDGYKLRPVIRLK